MHLKAFLTTTLLLISQSPFTTASSFELHQPAHRHLTIEQKARRDARSLMNHELYHLRRNAAPQAPGPSSSTSAPASPTAISGTNANFDRKLWNTSVSDACTNALSSMDITAINPSGMAACYNIPFLDNTTGVFEADLRLYQMSQPSGLFTGISPSDLSISLSYLAAQISSNQIVKRDSITQGPIFTTLSLSKRQDANSTVSMMAAFDFVGMINPAIMKTAPLNMTALSSILTPQIVLSAASPKNGAVLNATIDHDTISYVAGKFAGQANTNTTVNAARASAIAAAATAFVLPGVTLGIFPIGLIITGSWTVLFVGVVGWGTVGRIRFRGHYRRRLARVTGILPKGKAGW
jgi:hypothetical protein